MSRDRGPVLHRWGLAFCASVGLHLLFAVTVPVGFDPPKTEKIKAKPKPMKTVALMSESEAAKQLARAKAAPVKPTPKPPKKVDPEAPEPDGQIVEIPPPPKEEVPEDSRFLSEYNSKVEREQRARNRESPTPRVRKSDRRLIAKGQDAEGAVDRPDKPAQPDKKRPIAEVEKAGDSKREAAKKGPDAPPTPKPKKIVTPKSTPVPKGEGNLLATEEEAKAYFGPSGGGAVGGAPAPVDVRALIATQGPQEIVAKNGSIDHIEDIEDGDRTFLNSREYKYASFFNRMKSGVQQRWQAVEAHRRNDPYGRINGVRDRLTVVSVTLGPDGVLEDIHVTKDSGTPFLDDAALQAFREAQPFHNPPKGLQDPDGRIRFEFSFYLEISSRGFRFR